MKEGKESNKSGLMFIDKDHMVCFWAKSL